MKQQTKKALIGIVGGMGPAAGIDLSEKIIKNTLANTDQEHLPQILYTDSTNIADRSEFILGRTRENPAFAIADILMKLDTLGVTVAAVPCNSAHAPEIFDKVKKEIAKRGSSLHLLNMIDEVGKFIQKEYPTIKKVGIMGTFGTFHARQYDFLQSLGIETFYVSEQEQQSVHAAIYDLDFGIKANSNPISLKAKEIVNDSIKSLISKGAEAVILACTELALIRKADLQTNIPSIDSSSVLSRALVEYVAPEKLLPYRY